MYVYYVSRMNELGAHGVRGVALLLLPCRPAQVDFFWLLSRPMLASHRAVVALCVTRVSLVSVLQPLYQLRTRTVPGSHQFAAGTDVRCVREENFHLYPRVPCSILYKYHTVILRSTVGSRSIYDDSVSSEKKGTERKNDRKDSLHRTLANQIPVELYDIAATYSTSSLS